MTVGTNTAPAPEPDLQYCAECAGATWSAIRVGDDNYDVFVIRLGDINYADHDPRWTATVIDLRCGPIATFIDGDLALHDGSKDDEVALAAVRAALERHGHPRSG